jgi:RNA polymerase sigma-70 factor (ECF subfamily)
MNAWAFPIRPARILTSSSADRDYADARLAAGGDAIAFGRLYWHHAARIKALARRLLGPAEAEDGAQEVFVRAWHQLHQFRGDSAFGTWLHRLAVNVLLRELERGRRHRAPGAPLETIAAEPEPAPDVDLERALATLPPGIREVVVLHDMESYTHDEIGQMLGIGRSASKMRLHRGRSALRTVLAGGRKP